jgi:hypothetical protein
MEAATSLESPKKPPRNRNAPGGPPGNQHAKKHGVRALQIARRVGKIDKRTSFGQAFERRKREYIAHLGGEVSAMELAIIEDTVWTDFYTTNYDVYLSSLKSVVRKGRPHPVVDARTRLAAHRRENLKLLGLKRVSKTLSLQDILATNDHDDTPASTNGDQSTVHDGNGKKEG